MAVFPVLIISLAQGAAELCWAGNPGRGCVPDLWMKGMGAAGFQQAMGASSHLCFLLGIFSMMETPLGGVCAAPGTAGLELCWE